MFAKSSVLAVVALAAFVSLGALLFPQVVQAQDCLFDCFDLGSDPSFNPWGNSPGFDIAYCFDRDCVLNLKDRFGTAIFTGNSIPTPHVTHDLDPTVTALNCPGTPPSSPNGPFTVTISGNVIAVTKDPLGSPPPAPPSFISGSQANATLTIVVNGVTCFDSGSASGKILSKVLDLSADIPPVLPGQPRFDVFAATSHITIGPGIPTGKGWEQGCPTGPTAVCALPLGIVEFQDNTDLANHLPATAPYATVGEVYRAVQSAKFVGVRDCKGAVPFEGDPSVPDPSTIACSAGAITTGGNAEGAITTLGNWAGSGGKKINSKSGVQPFDIITPLFGNILPDTVVASANNGPDVHNAGCQDQPSQSRERCFFSASDLLPNGCISGKPVAILVRGKLDNGLRFTSRDNSLICNH